MSAEEDLIDYSDDKLSGQNTAVPDAGKKGELATAGQNVDKKGFFVQHSTNHLTIKMQLSLAAILAVSATFVASQQWPPNLPVAIPSVEILSVGKDGKPPGLNDMPVPTILNITKWAFGTAPQPCVGIRKGVNETCAAVDIEVYDVLYQNINPTFGSGCLASQFKTALDVLLPYSRPFQRMCATALKRAPSVCVSSEARKAGLCENLNRDLEPTYEGVDITDGEGLIEAYTAIFERHSTELPKLFGNAKFQDRN
ncbi:hypothetical protein B0H63DRAFT_519910 [Podospora didyma]|uniref:Uncharacterized protein n=1 Tax=Podospora didyma TaxID=330526 RepID=A0AAE0U508_9PEZI|nr:hypothetical protein B0H63DRAFT_519910 [Podospora didyma]